MKVNTNAHRTEIGTTKRQRDRLAEQRAKQLIERVRAREEKTARKKGFEGTAGQL